MLGDLAAHSAVHDPADVDLQLQCNLEAVDLATAVGVPSVLAFALHALGASLRLRDEDEDEAESVLERSLEIAENVDCRFVLTAAAQPGPRMQDIDDRNDRLIADWRRNLDHELVADLLDQGATVDTQTIVARLRDLAYAAHAS